MQSSGGSDIQDGSEQGATETKTNSYHRNWQSWHFFALLADFGEPIANGSKQERENLFNFGQVILQLS